MCGRFSLAEDLPAIAKRFDAEPVVPDWKPRYNIAPSQPVLAVIAEEGIRKLVSMTFGFIPHWAAPNQASFTMINAKAETIAEKPSFRESFRYKRCLIPADGFYEWLQTDHGKLPYRFTLKKGAMFGFAGIWDTWMDPLGKAINTFALITTDANLLARQLHDRMPVILQPKDESLWLDPNVTLPEKLQTMLQPYPAEEMEMFRVSPMVNSWRNETPDCFKPLES